MSRYIDADKLCEGLKDMAKYQEPYKQSTILGVVSTIENTPTADVVEVVRCGECRYCKYNRSADFHKCNRRWHYSEQVNVRDFCSYGERKEQ